MEVEKVSFFKVKYFKIEICRIKRSDVLNCTWLTLTDSNENDNESRWSKHVYVLLIELPCDVFNNLFFKVAIIFLLL